MPEIILNTAGTCRTTGTADPVILGETGKSGPFSDVPDGTSIAYFRRYSSDKAGFENSIGIWRSATNTIERTSVEKSSNGGDAVVWGVGEQTIEVTVTPDMIVADDDPRLVSQDLDDMTPGTAPTGVEKFATSQGGDPVYLTAQQIAGDPVRALKTHGLNYVREFSDFSRMRSTLVATDGSVLDLEPWSAHFSGTAAKVANLAVIGGDRGLLISSGTDTTGYAAIQHLRYSNIFLFSLAMETTFSLEFSTGGVLPTTEDGTGQVGFTNSVGALATVGMYFEATGASPNWFAVVRANGANVTKKDTLIPYVAGTQQVLKVVWDAPNNQTLFYIAGNLVQTILTSERVVPALTVLAMTAQYKKAAGSTASGFLLKGHSYAIETATLAGF